MKQNVKQNEGFLKRKNIEISAKRYGIDALSAMAQGLFCSLLIGTIIKTLGQQLGLEFLVSVGQYAFDMSGAAMAVAIGYALKADPLVLFSLTGVGYSANALGGAGGPLAVLFIAIIAAECGKAVSKETKIDILVTPAVTVLVGVGLAALIAPPIGAAAKAFGQLIKDATVLQPFWMGIVVSVLVGVALTLPISSAGLCAAFNLTGLAGGAAVAGCCAQMVGFAVMSFKENRWGGLVSQGIGTSMLQMPNIVRNPRVWIPPNRHHRTHCHLCVPAPDERPRQRCGLRHGHLRLCGTDRRVDGLGERRSHRGESRHHRVRLAGTGADLLCASGGIELGDLPGVPEAGLDQRGRFEAELMGASDESETHAASQITETCKEPLDFCFDICYPSM